MRRECRCRLCGSQLEEDANGECAEWETRYCSWTCYVTDQMLPPVPIERFEDVCNVKASVLSMRYTIIVRGDNDPVYKEEFSEEEDDIMR